MMAGSGGQGGGERGEQGRVEGTYYLDLGVNLNGEPAGA